MPWSFQGESFNGQQTNPISEKVHLWSWPRGHLHDNLQPVTGIRWRIPSHTFWNPDRDPIRPRRPGGGVGVLGRGAEVANSLPRPLCPKPAHTFLLVAAP